MTVAASAVDGLNVVEHRSHREIRTDRPVLLLHGIGGSADSCAPLAERLAAAGVPSWCLDAPGYGRSADPMPGVDVVAAVIDLIERTWPAQPVTLLGTSWGGVVAIAVALRRPEIVAALVLADSTRGSGTTAGKADAMLARIAELRERGADAVAAERAPRLTAPGAAPIVCQTVRRSMADIRIPGFTAAAEFMATTDHGPDLARVDCPTLVLVGEHDVITGVDESRALANGIRGAQLHIIGAAGHVAVQERPDTVADLVLEFLGGLS
ncbi:alpha/beta fold hydrolase [Gordonia insulae]|uniref:2-hydroxy-6-oxononadienedioate/2-hydroxy-6-oxononatrienedioate hydrolase n=1 Tax=Gordonia insulae TaxID=2420509 RepID=A0A3G8JRH8_9ACTN|nr:alpha/beta hydrolase [Gordonia insulae]AZG47325.1 2-hydroxy-6-oxononadienedioate/2-hydroxy-6-oxononatrienedioate hydrolase [Gordonia insulae]